MDSPIAGGLLACALGAAVAFVNYRLNLWALRKKPSILASLAFARQALNVACLVAVFLLARLTPWGTTAPLLGAAAGLTIPSILLSLRLARRNDAASAAPPAETDDPPEKGDDPHE